MIAILSFHFLHPLSSKRKARAFGTRFFPSVFLLGLEIAQADGEVAHASVCGDALAALAVVRASAGLGAGAFMLIHLAGVFHCFLSQTQYFIKTPERFASFYRMTRFPPSVKATGGENYRMKFVRTGISRFGSGTPAARPASMQRRSHAMFSPSVRMVCMPSSSRTTSSGVLPCT